ncbi:DMT family transporter [Umezawaea endophytica]|uniref:DMT family transporter n=1 Tax=Umezawaea endophytica TaxID=1654476 RepID=A0A9X2VTA0_9PSEU|nr:DMT family transporter [Umezawaea endophytica]MCS7482360.1 DMT family transporter [Umezawaea endophytica]
MPPRPHPPTPLTTAAITIALLAVSSSGPLIAFAAAPALALAFWRNTLAVAVLTPFTLTSPTRTTELRSLTTTRKREGLHCVLAGIALAAHFATWMPSIQLTSVATATALVATQPIWQALIARLQGHRVPITTWLGTVLAVAGVVIATGADLTVGGPALAGDLLALAGGACAAVYTAFGERARTAAVTTTTYTLVCYSVCAALLLAGCLVFRVPLVGFDATTWLAIAGLAVGAQLLGHSMFSYALHKVSASTVSLLILLEVPGAALIAWLWLGQVPRPEALPGLVLLLTGIAVVVVTRSRANRVAAVPS